MNKVSGKIVDEICKDPKNSTGLCMAYWDFDMGPTGYFIPNSKSPQFPKISLDFARDGVELEIKNYFIECSKLREDKQQEGAYCSLLRYLPTDKSELDGPTIVIGSQVMRDYYVILDYQLSRIGLAQKKSELCLIETTDYLVNLNDNPQLRLAVNSLYLVIVLVLSVKVTGGCVQFFDFGSSSASSSQA